MFLHISSKRFMICLYGQASQYLHISGEHLLQEIVVAGWVAVQVTLHLHFAEQSDLRAEHFSITGMLSPYLEKAEALLSDRECAVKTFQRLMFITNLHIRRSGLYHLMRCRIFYRIFLQIQSGKTNGRQKG